MLEWKLKDWVIDRQTKVLTTVRSLFYGNRLMIHPCGKMYDPRISLTPFQLAKLWQMILGSNERGQCCAHCTQNIAPLHRLWRTHPRPQTTTIPRPLAMRKRQKRQLDDETISCSVNPAYRRFKILVAWLLTRLYPKQLCSHFHG